MATSVTPQLPMESVPAPSKKGRSKRALKQKKPSTNEANILAGEIADSSPIEAPISMDSQKENHESLSGTKKVTKKGKTKGKQQEESSFEKELLEMQEMMQKMKIEKEKAEEILKEKDEMLKLKEEEIENKAREQKKLQGELMKLQKTKEFKPTLAFPTLPALNSNEVEKKDKKKKGGPEIKRPTSAYTKWCKDQWAEIKQETPDADFKETTHMLAAKWKVISSEDKKPYEEIYQAEREIYLQAMSKEKRESEAMKLLEEEQKQKTAMDLYEQYLQFIQGAGQEEDNKKKAKKEKDPLKPKRAMSAYLFYTNDRRPGLLAEGKTLCEVSKILGEEWNKMTDKQKKPYEVKAKVHKEKYLEDMEAYNQMKEEETAIAKKEEEELMKIQKHEALALLKKKEKTENLIKKTKEEKKKNKKEDKANDPNKPKKPASSYILFSQEARKNLKEERPAINNSTMTALISVKWSEMSEEERQIWNGKAAESMEVYKNEIEKYNKSVAAQQTAQESEDEA